MKKVKFIFILLVALLCCNSCEKDLGVQTLVGKITYLTNPSSGIMSVPCLFIGLETDMCDYYIKIDSHTICGEPAFVVEDIVYSFEDEVEITGRVTFYRGNYSIEIISIRKLP